MKNGKLKPWNFPINVNKIFDLYSEIAHKMSHETLVKLTKYSVNEKDIEMLLHNEDFKVYYAIAVYTVIHWIEKGDVHDDVILILITSLSCLSTVVKQGTSENEILCILSKTLHYALIESKIFYKDSVPRTCMEVNGRNILPETRQFLINMSQMYK